ncbi:50S ribosomal protein L6 [Candidatus Gottesmanbacteria bacterium RIFCSPHIGHO2_01_FULL_39_10]|uniref:Large ribosomal subunit protein uL6 n=1 Tax=Candidatus Gottesmanbacteria bacterium RIFCSPHIGHO2_01_FULL_39_10 TaxID=1798375 RepID=A0A1F5ZRV4_9BACT|nr:MAG: 50S ribosomal protein L6 [Candidatus Gottesmanbacteria bacterium RIFCSPHIGHO2_01_FULL_39_10]
MSRIGQKPIEILSGITVNLKDQTLEVAGSMGKMQLNISDKIQIKIDGNLIKLESKNEHPSNKSLLGLYRTLINNAIVGAAKSWAKSLELVGVGYRAQTSGQELNLSLGFSHPIIMQAPPGIKFEVAENKITVSGMDKYLVGEIAAKIRRLKKPEPYKGKGIKYVGEKIRKKAGKATKALGGAPGAK